MWIGKFKIKHDCWILQKTVKYGFSAVGLPLNSFERNGKKYHTGLDFLKGSKESKEKFIQSLHKDKRIKKFVIRGNQLLTLIEGSDFVAHAFDPSLFFISPVLQKDGFEYWEIGSWERKTLLKFYNDVKTFGDIKMLKLRREVPSFIVHQALPKLTMRQEEALHLAQDLGYYEYPRKISVEELAKRLKVPRTTFQAHLRKAEKKMMEMIKSSF